MIVADTPPPDIFHDSIWQFISVVIAIIVAAIGFIGWWLERKARRNEHTATKDLAFEVRSDVPIANINSDVKDRVQVLFDGEPAQDMRLTIIRLWNAGSVSVRRTDYDEHVTFTFVGRKVRSCEFLDSEPPDLVRPDDVKSLFKEEGDTVSVEPLLLNPGESITAKVLATGSAGEVIGRVRLADGQIVRYDEAYRQALEEKAPAVVRVGSSLLNVLAVALSLVVVQVLVNSVLSNTPGLTNTHSQAGVSILLAVSFVVTLAIISVMTLYTRPGFSLRRVFRNGMKLRW